MYSKMSLFSSPTNNQVPVQLLICDLCSAVHEHELLDGFITLPLCTLYAAIIPNYTLHNTDVIPH